MQPQRAPTWDLPHACLVEIANVDYVIACRMTRLCKAWRRAALEARPASLSCITGNDKSLIEAFVYSPISSEVSNVALHCLDNIPDVLPVVIHVRCPHLRHLDLTTSGGAQGLRFLKHLPKQLLSLWIDCACNRIGKKYKFDFGVLDRFSRLKSFGIKCFIDEHTELTVFMGDVSLPFHELSISFCHYFQNDEYGGFTLPLLVISPNLTLNSVKRNCIIELEPCLVKPSVCHPKTRRGKGRFPIEGYGDFMQLLTKDPDDIPAYPWLCPGQNTRY